MFCVRYRTRTALMICRCKHISPLCEARLRWNTVPRCTPRRREDYQKFARERLMSIKNCRYHWLLVRSRLLCCPNNKKGGLDECCRSHFYLIRCKLCLAAPLAILPTPPVVYAAAICITSSHCPPAGASDRACVCVTVTEGCSSQFAASFPNRRLIRALANGSRCTPGTVGAHALTAAST